SQFKSINYRGLIFSFRLLIAIFIDSLASLHVKVLLINAQPYG
ncbi:MAG: hypothetical protein ACJAT7_003560, partial [Psychromonas sp.]